MLRYHHGKCRCFGRGDYCANVVNIQLSPELCVSIQLYLVCGKSVPLTPTSCIAQTTASFVDSWAVVLNVGNGEANPSLSIVFFIGLNNSIKSEFVCTRCKLHEGSRVILSPGQVYLRS